jgi:hypothetical protein
MFVALCEPDFKNPALMLATYECSVCGLRDRAQATIKYLARFNKSRTGTEATKKWNRQ